MVIQVEQTANGRWIVTGSLWYGHGATRWEAIRDARARYPGAMQAVPLEWQEIPGQLRKAADILEDCGRLMEYRGGFGPWAAKGREAIGAAEIAREWAGDMEA